MLWTEDTRQYKTSAFCSKYRAASHLAANFPNFPGEVAAACEIRGGEDDGWGRLLTVAGVTSPRRRQPTLYNFTHWLGRRQIRAKYFQKVVKGSVTELSRSVDCIRCVTDLPPPPLPAHHSTVRQLWEGIKLQKYSVRFSRSCGSLYFRHILSLWSCFSIFIFIIYIKLYYIKLSILFNLTKLSKYSIKSCCLFSTVFRNFLCL